MKKTMKFLLTIVFALSVVPFSAYAIQEGDEISGIELEPQVVMYDSLKDEFIMLQTKVDNAETYMSGQGEYTSECDVTVYVPSTGITPRDSQSTTRDENAITSTLKITYYLGGTENNRTIKMTGISGSWTANGTYGLELRNQVVALTDGAGWLPGIGDQSERWYPSGSSFNYTVDWDYAALYPQIPDTSNGPRGYSEAEFRITGMGSTWYNIFTFLPINIY